MNKDVTIVTIDTGPPAAPYYTRDEFYASVRKFGYEPLVLREGYGGLGTKPRIVWKAIREGLIKTPYMVFVDCYDVVMQREISVAMLTYRTVEITWGAEKNCFPDPDRKYASAHPLPRYSPFRYLNSGVGFGEVDAFARLFLAMNADLIPADYIDEHGRNICPCDQEYIMQQFLIGPIEMALDTSCRLVCNLHDVSESEIGYDQDFVVVATGGDPQEPVLAAPSFLHFNGSAKTSGLREPILKHLGYL